ncbi:MAG: spermidine/putrescine ABC transporter substrate-binding protein [Spirochaetaceae bacterium]|jgi:spermidine/putrescine-binding protein|nr:spermidine/putrescine ABC transporter substrate-binding protein [Spirochaetaceae bacterium]
MRKLVILAALICSGVSVPFAGAQNRQQLVILTFEEMIPPEVIAEFTRETGIAVEIRTGDYNEDILAALESSGGAGYDLVIADDYMVDFAIQTGFAQKLNRRSIANFGNINPMFQHHFYDPHDEYTVPYGAGILSILYDPSKVNFPIEGYADLWNPALRGRVGIIGNYRIVNGFALQTLRKSFNDENVADINAAGQRLLSLAPNIRVVQDAGLDQEILNGNIFAGIMFTESVTKARMANPNLRVVFPKEGIGFGIMPAFIPSHAPNAQAAHRFLNFILDPVRGARCFEYLGYYCTFQASEQHIRSDLRDFFIMPSNYRNFEFLFNIDEDADNAHRRIWSSFQTAVERARRGR